MDVTHTSTREKCDVRGVRERTVTMQAPKQPSPETMNALAQRPPVARNVSNVPSGVRGYEVEHSHRT